jgi:hypothetical protein
VVSRRSSLTVYAAAMRHALDLLAKRIHQSVVLCRARVVSLWLGLDSRVYVDLTDRWSERSTSRAQLFPSRNVKRLEKDVGEK